MKTFNDEQAVQSITNTGILASVDHDEQEPLPGQKWIATSKEVSFQPDSNSRLRIDLREALYYRLTNLASCLLSYREGTFQSCLRWFTDWGMWNDHDERIAHRMIDVLRAAHSEKRQLIETPAHLFDESEVVDAHTLLTTALVASWDLYLVPWTGDFVILNSHHEYVEVIFKNTGIHQNRLDVLREWGAYEEGMPGS
jgi:hypothetical protein